MQYQVRVLQSGKGYVYIYILYLKPSKKDNTYSTASLSMLTKIKQKIEIKIIKFRPLKLVLTPCAISTYCRFWVGYSR